MNTGMKMMMVTNRSRGDNRSGGRTENRTRGGMNYDGTENEMEARRRYRRDSRGRFRSEMEMGDMEYEPEMRRAGYGGRNEMMGRYGEGETRPEVRGAYPYPFPVYEGGRSNMNPIGFDPYREIETNYQMNATHRTGNEMEHRSSAKMGGGYSSDMSTPMNREMAEEWTKNMKNEDGTKGPHWKMEQIKQVMSQKGVDCDPWEFYAIMNALYSDYCSVFKKHGVNTVDLYVDLACAWLNDTDAFPDKASRYYEYVVKK